MVSGVKSMVIESVCVHALKLSLLTSWFVFLFCFCFVRVSKKRHGDWSSAVESGNDDACDLGPIPNEMLMVEEDGEGQVLKRGLQEGADYVLVSATVWEKLYEWYGGGPEIMRPMIEVGFMKKRLVVVCALLLFLLLLFSQQLPYLPRFEGSVSHGGARCGAP